MKIVGWIIFIACITILTCTVINTCNDTANVVSREFNASALLKKYEYFKDLSAAIDKKRADIEMYKEGLKDESLEKSEKYSQQAELRGIIAIHNNLCAEYNSAMSKFNYRFTNRGDLPASNLEPLPREIKPYITSTK